MSLPTKAYWKMIAGNALLKLSRLGKGSKVKSDSDCLTADAIFQGVRGPHRLLSLSRVRKVLFIQFALGTHYKQHLGNPGHSRNWGAVYEAMLTEVSEAASLEDLLYVLHRYPQGIARAG